MRARGLCLPLSTLCAVLVGAPVGCAGPGRPVALLAPTSGGEASVEAGAGVEAGDAAVGATDDDAASAAAAHALHAATRIAVSERGAASQLAVADDALERFRGFAIVLEPPTGDVVGQIHDGARRVARIVAEYDAVLAFRRPERSVAALLGQAEAYEILARALRGVRLASLPAIPLAPTPGSPPAPPGAPSDLLVRMAERLEPEIRVIECLGIYRVLLAARVARSAALDDALGRAAADRVRATGDDRVSECVELARRGDPERGIERDATIPPYAPGELGPAPTSADENPVTEPDRAPAPTPLE